MKKYLTAIALTFLFALHARAALYVYPPGPDSETPIEIGTDEFCHVASGSATVEGNVIRVSIQGDCHGTPPISRPYSVKVPQLLAPGTYTVVLAGTEKTTQFIVRDAHPRFTVHPYAVPKNVDPGFAITIENAAAECASANCQIRVGVGTDNTLVTPRIEGAHLVFDAPRRNTTGETHVTIVRNNADIFLRGALAYYDPKQPADPSIFEPVLIPLLFNTKGSNGSDWRSELAAFNPNPWPIESHNDLGTIVSPCIDGPCGERLGPNEYLKLDGGNFPRGHVLFVPRNDADDVSFSLRVRDVSRVAEGFGTEIPVVRERDQFRNETIPLLDVPVDPRYRAKLRVYALEPMAGSLTPHAMIRIVSQDGRETEASIALAGTNPAYGEFDLPAGAAGEAVDLLIDTLADVPAWAFVSVTNNETQQVTLVLPDGDKGPDAGPARSRTAHTLQHYGISTVPGHPRQGDDVQLRVAGDCIVDATLQRDGNVIRVSAQIAICSPPLPTELTIPAGDLPPGRYEVIMHRTGDTATIAEAEFTVLSAIDPPFDVQPFAIPATLLAPLEVRIDDGARDNLRCPDCAIFVDDTLVQPRYREDGIFITPPQHAPGYADIRIVQANGELVYPGAIYYHDLTTAPDLALFERILFPVLFNTPGANGSNWLSETTMRNLGAWSIETRNDIVPGQCIDYPCFERIPAGERREFIGGDYANGVALLTPREDADVLAAALRVRDISRSAEGLGTAIPIVRENDMFRDTDLTLLDVPVDTRYRVKLRVYAFGESSTTATLVTHDVVTNARTRTPLTLTRTCTTPLGCAAAPAVAVADLPAGANGARVNLFVEMPERALGWAFATVTNNMTQQVTIVTADGTGGEGCSGCTMP